MKLSIIIPALNEAENIKATLGPLQVLRQGDCEIILVDGGSKDDTTELAQKLVDKIISVPRGRANQMNAGAVQADGDVFWFLHSDTLTPDNADQLIEQALASDRHWGRFNVRLSGSHTGFRIIEWMMNIRSCITGIATGDQGIFIEKKVFEQLDGYASIPLMEDIDISKRLMKNHGRPACIDDKLITSSRRWEQQGIIKTVLLMWQLRLSYYLGTDPDTLAGRYSRH